MLRIAVPIAAGVVFVALALVIPASHPLPASERGDEPLRWRLHVINAESPFEAAGASDFNGDGRIDIFCGDSWYEAPGWARHRVRDVPASAPNPHYHEDFADLPLDVNGDGRPDIVTCTYFTRRVGWVENPADPTGRWTEHEIDTPGPSEAGQLVDVNGDGRPDFLPNTVNTVVWYELAAQKPEVRWVKHELGTEGAGHGVGMGDVNGDGRLDILTPKGWHEQPEDASSNKWPFHNEFELGAAGILILGRDLDGDDRTDILWGMGHNFGLFWMKQGPGPGGKREWQRREIDKSFSQVHTLLLADLDGDGESELITGKRIYAHEVEPGATDRPCIYAFTHDRLSGKWTRRVIFEGQPAQNAPAEAKDRQALRDFPRGSAGTGLQIDARDMDGDGDTDLVCPGKSGLYLFENLLR